MKLVKKSSLKSRQCQSIVVKCVFIVPYFEWLWRVDHTKKFNETLLNAWLKTQQFHLIVCYSIVWFIIAHYVYKSNAYFFGFHYGFDGIAFWIQVYLEMSSTYYCIFDCWRDSHTNGAWCQYERCLIEWVFVSNTMVLNRVASRSKCA